MAVMTEFVERQVVTWRKRWDGQVLKCKETSYRPYDKAFVVMPRIYAGSRKDVQAALVLNCADTLDAKATFYAHLGIDPNAQYTDVQRYEPEDVAETAGSNNPTKRANVRVVE